MKTKSTSSDGSIVILAACGNRRKQTKLQYNSFIRNGYQRQRKQQLLGLLQGKEIPCRYSTYQAKNSVIISKVGRTTQSSKSIRLSLNKREREIMWICSGIDKNHLV